MEAGWFEFLCLIGLEISLFALVIAMITGIVFLMVNLLDRW